MIKLKWISLLISLFFMLHAKSQEDIFEKRITISFGRITKYEALKRIGHELSISFSYKEGLLRNNDIVYIDYKNVSVIEILDELFEGEISVYICDGRTIIIKRRSIESEYLAIHGRSSGKDDIYVEITDPVISIPPMQILDPQIVSKISPEDSVRRELKLILSFSEDYSQNDSGKWNTISDQKASCNSQVFLNRSVFPGKSVNLMKFNPRASRGRQTYYMKDDKCFHIEGSVRGCKLKEPDVSFKTCISVSPHFTWIPDSKFKMGMEGGLAQDISYKRKLTLRPGILYSTQYIAIYPLDESDSVSRQITINYFIIPVSFAWSVYATNYSSASISVGLYQYLFSNRELPYIHNDPYIEWLPYLNLSAGYERTWFSRFSWFVEPFFRFPLTENVHFRLLTKFGVTLGIKYNGTPSKPYSYR